VAVEVLNLLFPKKSYDASHADNKYKTATMETAANVFALGLAGLMNFYTNDGGLNSGKLGGVSSIRLDYNTDLTVQFTPYSYDTVYLKDFTGDTYLPYTNQWTVSRTMIEELKSESREAAALEQAYQQGADYTAKGYMNITNVDAVSSVYLPYYSRNNHTVVQYGLTETYTYYPRLTGNETTLEEYQVPEEYLTVPEENLETIEAFCREAGFGGTQEEVISQVIQYYQDQIPYTIRPGATPKNQDFINYFLSKNKKGYCAHFASAATLIFRYYGIPARYAEGYAISYNDVVDGELLDASYSDYYDGYSEIGATGLVEVDVTDADAHAWVEVYDPNYGWVVVDVTPSGAQEDETEDFWSAFQKLFDQEDEDTAADENGSSGLQIRLGDNFMQRIAFVVLVILCGIVVFFAGKPVVRFLQFQAAYRQAGRNDRLVMEYNRYFQKKKKKDQALSKQMNYRSQIAYLVEHGYMELGEAEEKHMVDIMQQAGFSNREISASDFDFAAEQLRRKKN
jgi:transglutaminase-like putative cysteine protease